MSKAQERLSSALWRIYRRPERPLPWIDGGNLPWDQPDFSRRMLREHLDESHGAASRVTIERRLQIDWLWIQLGLRPGARVLDVTCGPGLYAVELAERGCEVTGIDFAPASIAYARELAKSHNVSDRCTFELQDVRQMSYQGHDFDAALFLYGQLAVFSRQNATSLLAEIARALRPGGRLCVELLNQDRIDKQDSNWWFTDNSGLWGDKPFLHLGERFWDGEKAISMERFYTLHLETGELDKIVLCDQSYRVEEMIEMMRMADFNSVSVYPAWEGLSLYDAEEWVVYITETDGKARGSVSVGSDC